MLLFLLPLFFNIFLFFSLDNAHQDKYLFFANENIFIVAISVIPICLFVVPLFITQCKQSILLRKIAQTEINVVQYILFIFFYFVFLCIISVIYGEICWLCFINVHINNFNVDYNIGNIIYSIILLIFVSVSIGILIGILLKSTVSIILLSLCALLITFMLSGIFSSDLVANSNVIKYINLFSPLNYPLMLVNQSFSTIFYNTNNIFDFSNNFVIKNTNYFYINQLPEWVKHFALQNFKYLNDITYVWYYIWQKILAIFIPWVITFLFILISIRFNKWLDK